MIRGSAGIYYGPLVYADYGQGTVQGFTVQGNLFTADPLDGVPLDNGLQALSTTPDLNPNQLDGTQTSADLRGKKQRTPGNGRELGARNPVPDQAALCLSTLGYLGNHATHLHAMLDFMNDMPDKDMALGDWLNWWAAAPGPAGWFGVRRLNPTPTSLARLASHLHLGMGRSEAQALRPFPQITYINMDSYLQNLGQSTYEALEAKLEQRFHNGLNILASYTFSKTLTDADVIQPYWSTLQNGGAVQDPENLRG